MNCSSKVLRVQNAMSIIIVVLIIIKTYLLFTILRARTARQYRVYNNRRKNTFFGGGY